MSSEPPQSTPPVAAGDGSASGPTPQTIGIRFVKTYYQVLSTTPDQIFKFYKPSSVLSHGEGSTPTSAVDFEKYDLKVRWGEAQRFDFDNGAIDAQPSSDGSILLVVTGHVLVKIEDGKEERKGFVHTFFLSLVSLPNKQKTYYVKNDILRFLKADAPSVTDAAAPAAPTPEPPVAVTPEPVKEEPEPVEEPAVVEEEPVKEEKKEEEEPTEVVVEEKTDAPKEEPPKVEEEPAPAEEKPQEPKEEPAKETTPEPKKKEGKGKRQRGGRAKSPQNTAAKQQPASKPAPGSWASLVASGSGPAATPAPQASSTPSKPPVSEKKTETPSKPKKEDKPDTPSIKENGKSNKDKPKRDPDNTLVIKNLPDGTKEPELLAIFQQFAVQTNAKIVSSTISSHRGLAFVDYDSVAPVMAAVEQHGKDPIQLNGKVLEVDQKTAEQRARKARGGGYRSGSPNQNNNNRGGGRQNKRNNGGRGGKGNRGGGGGGNSGGGNKDGGGGR